MKPAAAALLVTLLPCGASAGSLTCTFTEPFFTIIYDSDTGIVTKLANDEAGPGHEFELQTIAENATLILDKNPEGHPSATLMSGGDVLLRARFSGQGSDGMSGRVYPIEAQWGVEPRANNIGGCVTGNAPGFDIYELYDELGLEP